MSVNYVFLSMPYTFALIIIVKEEYSQPARTRVI